MRFFTSLVLCAIALASSANHASAQCGGSGFGYGGFGYGGFGGYNFGIHPYVPSPPYFALHPPVYYGQRYTRPYGDSPFAAPSQLQPNPAYAPAPHVTRSLTVDNPYVLPLAPEAYPVPAPTPVPTEATSPVVQAQPLVIDNPYFQPAKIQLADR